MSKTRPEWNWEGWGGVPVGASEVDRLAWHAFETLNLAPAETEVAFCMTGDRMLIAEKDEHGAITVYDCVITRISRTP